MIAITTSFSKNVVIAKTSYQMLEILLYSDQERAFTSVDGNKRANFGGEKSTAKLSGVFILENRRENLKLNVFLAVVLVLESKAL